MTGPRAGGDHLPVRPQWRCAACGQDWPCRVARIRLADEYRREPIAISIYLCAQMHDAIADLDPIRRPGLTPAGYYARFLAWVRPDGLP